MTVCPNDTQDEIEKIMNEIENLQEAMNETAEAPSVESIEAKIEEEPVIDDTVIGETEPMAEFRDSGSDVSMEETLGELREEEPAPSGGMLASIGETPEPEVHEPEIPEQPVRLAYERPQSPQRSAEGGALSLRLTGSMTLTLEYEYEGEQVTVGFSDNMLRVQLSDGTEFKIPVRRETKLRRVA